MPVFKYTGMVGSKRTEGEIQAANIEDATRILTGRNIAVENIFKKPTELSFSFGTGIKTKDIVVFTRQFSTMLNAGINLVDCLSILGEQIDNKAFKNVIQNVRNEVESGKPLNEALRKYPKVFNNLYCSLVEAGEAGGLLTNVLDRLSIYMEKNMELIGKVKSAMTYPVIILIVALALIIGMMYFVIPTFEEMFDSMGQTLPSLTQFVVNVSRFTQKYIVHIILVIISSVVIFVTWKRTKKGRYTLDKIILKTPIFGDITKKNAVARFSRTFGTLVASGVDILKSMEITARTAGNSVIEAELMKARTKVSGGSEIAVPLGEAKVFPPMVVSMISAGEKSGSLEDMLAKIADFYEMEVDQAVGTLTTALEPLIMVFLGGGIGTIVIALFMPMFTMVSAIS
ncbi:MAG TPA: type II secretion system F family protein [Candidatus Mcinerneyibacteriales bacterium]|nr:type II secretion system F family protein [Candidatus Mcinerneyibacteriales bacterium]